MRHTMMWLCTEEKTNNKIRRKTHTQNSMPDWVHNCCYPSTIISFCYVRVRSKAFFFSLFFSIFFSLVDVIFYFYFFYFQILCSSFTFIPWTMLSACLISSLWLCVARILVILIMSCFVCVAHDYLLLMLMTAASASPDEWFNTIL